MRSRDGTSGAIRETAERRFSRFRSKFMDKPFKTIEEQIEILESRGMRTDEYTALALMREGYYSIINGYKDLFIDREATAAEGHDVYRAGTTFKEVHRLFTFDRDLRLTMFRYFSIAEAALKTACAYSFSEKHAGEFEPYLDKGNYRQDRKHSKWIDDLILDFNTALGRNPKKKPKRKAYLEHYRSNHDEVPLWVLLRYMTLGQSFKFFEFQDESMRNDIAKHFSQDCGLTLSNIMNFLTCENSATSFTNAADFTTLRSIWDIAGIWFSLVGRFRYKTKIEGGAEAPPLRNPDDTQCIILEP